MNSKPKSVTYATPQVSFLTIYLSLINISDVRKTIKDFNNHQITNDSLIFHIINPLSANPTKWSNTHKQFA